MGSLPGQWGEGERSKVIGQSGGETSEDVFCQNKLFLQNTKSLVWEIYGRMGLVFQLRVTYVCVCESVCVFVRVRA